MIESLGDTAYGMAFQGEKILVCGIAQSSGGRGGGMGLARFSADGVLDTTFGTGGRSELMWGRGALAQAVAVRSDGKIYTAGTLAETPTTTGANFGIVRFSADGAIDRTFGGPTGMVEGDFGKNEFARGISFQGLKVLVGGGEDFIVARYDDAGALDTTFGTAGRAISPGGQANNFIALPSGELLLSGSIQLAMGWTIKLVRYTANGQLDATFGTRGVVETNFDTFQAATLVLATMADGRVVIVTQDAMVLRASVARFLPTGAVDTSFGTAGLRRLELYLPTVTSMFPVSPNQGVIVNDRLFLTATNFPDPFVLFGATAL